MSQAPLRIALAGLGTVGSGVVRVLEETGDLIAQRATRPIVVTAVSARNRRRARPVDISAFAWEDDAPSLAARPDVDVVVELVGGSDGPALELARASFAAGKSFVTANKAMIAHHGLELAQMAEAKGCALKFEAAVAGGIPVIKGLRDGLSANRITGISGILNGTCNYILSVMATEGLAFDKVLADAQALGYAEADPSFDIDGIDAAHKLAILASLAYGSKPRFDDVAVSGIRSVTPIDLAYAEELGYRVRLVGMAQLDAGRLFQRVHPCLVPLGHPLASVNGSTNAVVLDGNHVGRVTFEGPGAGEGPTASAVVADLIDIARGEFGPGFAMPAASLSDLAAADPAGHVGRAYIRLTVEDRPGVLAEIAGALRDADVSAQSVIQRGEAPEGGVYFVLVTHAAPQSAINRVLETLKSSSHVKAAPVMMHLLDDKQHS